MNKLILAAAMVPLTMHLSYIVLGADAAPANAPVKRIALLVGVDKYPKLRPDEQLKGSANDVILMHQVLTERFGFARDEVQVLVNEQATASAIRGEMARLVEQSRSAEAAGLLPQVVFHFSGHGSQVVDEPMGPNRDELDGLDETLVPYDATRQGGPEDIRDDELYFWASEICTGGKSCLWMILDCCHSGSGARGTSRMRQLNRPEAAATQAVPGTLERRSLPHGAVLLSACLARESEPEYEQDGEANGLLTRFMTQVLNDQSQLSQLSYERMRDAIENRYRQDAAVMQPPTPQLEADGDTRRGIVLGAGPKQDRLRVWRVMPRGRDLGHVLLMAGAFQGVTRDSLFELYAAPELAAAPARRESDSLAWLRVEQVTGAAATCRVLQREGDEAVEATLPTEFKLGYAVERFHKHGDFTLRVRVVLAQQGNDEPALDQDSPAVPPSVRQALTSAHQRDESSWLRWVTGSESCDVVIRIADSWAALWPATGLAYTPMVRASVPRRHSSAEAEAPAVLRGGWGPIDLRLGDKSESKLQDWLRQIARARNLVRLANVDHGSSIQVGLTLTSVTIDQDGHIANSMPWPPHLDENRQASLVMRDGGLYSIEVHNLEPAETGQPIYVTVLHVDANMGIDVLLPFQAGSDPMEQKVLPSTSRNCGAWECNSDDPAAGPRVHGPRWAIVLATREPHDFSMLQHASLPMVKAVRGLGSSLHDLLMEQTHFRARGGSKPLRPVKLFDDTWNAAVLEWVVTP